MSFGVDAPWFKGPVETMAFNLWAMEESRKDELRSLAYKLATSNDQLTFNMGLTQSEWRFVQDEVAKIKGGL